MAKILRPDSGESTERANTVAEEQTAQTYTRDAQRTADRSAVQGREDVADAARRAREGSDAVSADLKRGANPLAARPRGDQPPPDQKR